MLGKGEENTSTRAARVKRGLTEEKYTSTRAARAPPPIVHTPPAPTRGWGATQASHIGQCGQKRSWIGEQPVFMLSVIEEIRAMGGEMLRWRSA
jgi:hypothetical protein